MPKYKDICPVCLSERNITRQYRGGCAGICSVCKTDWWRTKSGGEMRIKWDTLIEYPNVFRSMTITYKELKEKLYGKD